MGQLALEKAVALILTLIVVVSPIGSPASAQTIDLTKVYGDKDGCINRSGQEIVSDRMLLLKEGRLVTAYSACEIGAITKGANGSLSFQANCDAEGEISNTSFRIVAAKKKGRFVIYDKDNNSLGEVALCRR